MYPLRKSNCLKEYNTCHTHLILIGRAELIPWLRVAGFVPSKDVGKAAISQKEVRNAIGQIVH